MIIVRSPLRISLGGGGTDLPSYYERFGGFVLAAAIDKYVYITIHERFQEEFLLKYSQLEQARSTAEIKHPIFRAALELLKCTRANLEISSIADIPANTGLGSSGSFTTALLQALHNYRKHQPINQSHLADQACHIEIDILKEPVGKQDQYIAAFGGVTCLDIAKDGKVRAYPAEISMQTLYTLEDNLALFFTGYSRLASSILSEQDQKSRESEASMLENLHITKDIGLQVYSALQKGDLNQFGALMHEHWELKRQRSSSMTSAHIDELYQLGRKSGALGGKLVGAGGGGFLLFYTENKGRLRNAMAETGLHELRFRFDFEGTKTLTVS